jgi:hypothetical protein
LPRFQAKLLKTNYFIRVGNFEAYGLDKQYFSRSYTFTPTFSRVSLAFALQFSKDFFHRFL